MNTNFEVNKKSTTTTWLTPPEIIKSLGEFDTDPCAPVNRPWNTAKIHYTEIEDGLKQDWFGRVWLNPPYGKIMIEFLKKMAMHNNGIALTFTRTETEQFHKWVWPYADAVLFTKGRIKFLNIKGDAVGTPGCGSMFIAYGKENAEILKNSGIKGKFILLK